MSTALSEQDLILLNAYLDDELSTGEKEAFEQRLIREPALQAELESLRVTVAILQMAERVPVPRNFTLGPAQYGTPQKAGLLARLGLGSVPRLVAAGAALLVVLVCVGVIIMNGGVGLSGAPSVAEEPMFALEEAPAEEEAAEIAPAAEEEQRAADEQAEEPAPETLVPQAAIEEEAEGAVAEDSAAAAVESEAVEEEMAEEEIVEEPSEEEDMAEEFVQMPSELPPGTGTGGGFGGANNGEGDQATELPTATPPGAGLAPSATQVPAPASTVVAEAPNQPADEVEEQGTIVDEAGETAKAFEAQSPEQPDQPPAEQAAATAPTTEEPSLPNWATGLMVVIGLLVIVLAVLSFVILTRRRAS